MKKLIGIIQEDGTVKSNNKIFTLPFRGSDEEGFPEVLMDAKDVGGDSVFYKQSIKQYIGMKVEFFVNKETKYGFNYKIIK